MWFGGTKKKYVVRMLLSEEGDHRVLSYRRVRLDLDDKEAFLYSLSNIRGAELFKDAECYAKSD